MNGTKHRNRTAPNSIARLMKSIAFSRRHTCPAAAPDNRSLTVAARWAALACRPRGCSLPGSLSVVGVWLSLRSRDPSECDSADRRGAYRGLATTLVESGRFGRLERGHRTQIGSGYAKSVAIPRPICVTGGHASEIRICRSGLLAGLVGLLRGRLGGRRVGPRGRLGGRLAGLRGRLGGRRVGLRACGFRGLRRRRRLLRLWCGVCVGFRMACQAPSSSLASIAASTA